uniref:Uncharacterized protein n=1 Tax=Oryza glaberrima TaxID=4538 RepID=I1R8Y0_ORYGL
SACYISTASPAMAAAAREDIHPATMAYIHHLVEVFRTTSFDEACYDQNYMGSDADIFRHRPGTTAVPDDVGGALDAIEEILRKGSPTLAADERLDILYNRTLQEETVGAVEDAVASMEAQVAGDRGTVDAKKLRLKAVRAAAAEYRDGLAALMTAADGAEEQEATAAVMSLLERLDAAESEAAALAADVDGFDGLVEQLAAARERLVEEKARLDAIPVPSGDHREDDVIVFRAADRFNRSVRVLREFVAQYDA